MLLRSLVFVTGVAACSDSGNQAQPDATPAADAAGCRAEATYPDFGSDVRGYGLDYPSNTTGSATTAHAQVVVQTLNAVDVMFLQLNADFGAFGSGEIVPGTYVIADDDLDPSLCGICLDVWPKSLDGTSLAAVTEDYLLNERYIAVAGAITLTTAGGSANGSNTISGSISNVSFKHAIIQDDGSFQYAPDGCTTSIGSGAFGPYKLAVGESGSAVVKLRRRSVN